MMRICSWSSPIIALIGVFVHFRRRLLQTVLSRYGTSFSQSLTIAMQSERQQAIEGQDYTFEGICHTSHEVRRSKTQRGVVDKHNTPVSVVVVGDSKAMANSINVITTYSVGYSSYYVNDLRFSTSTDRCLLSYQFGSERQAWRKSQKKDEQEWERQRENRNNKNNTTALYINHTNGGREREKERNNEKWWEQLLSTTAREKETNDGKTEKQRGQGKRRRYHGSSSSASVVNRFQAKE